MRIGIIINTMASVLGLNSGGTIHALEVARRWREDQIVVFAPELGREFVKKYLPNAEFVAMPSCERLAGSPALLFAYRALLAARRAGVIRSCDVVLAASHLLPDIVPALLARKRHAAVCVWHTIAGPFEREGATWNNIIAYMAERLSLVAVRCFLRSVIVGSDTLRRRMGLEDSEKRRVVITTNGVDQVRHQRAPVAVSSNNDGPVAVFVGRIHPTKGVLDLVEIWGKVCSSMPHARLVLIGGGDPEFVAQVRARVRAAGLEDNVSMLGAIDDEAKVTALRQARVFVFPSKEEGWGIALAEAMALGLPCVTYDVPVFAEVFPVGRLEATMGDTQRFATLVVDLLSNDELHETVRAQAGTLARGFTWEAAAREEARALTFASGQQEYSVVPVGLQ